MYKTLRQICADTGVTRRAIQGYEKMGLVAPVSKIKYGHLLYNEMGEERIRTIHFYQQIGCPLAEIKGLLDAPNSVKKEVLQIKATELEKQKKLLHQLIHQLSAHIAEL